MPLTPCGPGSIVPARPADVHALDALEHAAFDGDRISARSWRRLLASPSARVLVCRANDALQGACVVLRRKGSSVARLYSIAVMPAARGSGLSARLLSAALAAIE